MVTDKPIIAYCDYIGHLISKELKALDHGYYQLIDFVGRPLYDLGEYGQFASTKKTVNVTDKYGKRYTITIEEAS
jgi:hypothetical protein